MPPRLVAQLSLAAPLFCAGCVVWQDAPRLSYQCPNDLRFEARLYKDMALLEGQRGFTRLARTDDGQGGAPRYRDGTLLAEFGLGLNGRLAALRYTGIPETVYCQRVLAQGTTPDAVRAARRLAPTPPPSADPAPAGQDGGSFERPYN